jgi:hypothetical protein
VSIGPKRPDGPCRLDVQEIVDVAGDREPVEGTERPIIGVQAPVRDVGGEDRGAQRGQQQRGDQHLGRREWSLIEQGEALQPGAAERRSRSDCAQGV